MFGLRPYWVMLAMLLLGVCPPSAPAMRVVEARWGVQGLPVGDGFCLLSVELDNDSPDVFQGQIVLRDDLERQAVRYVTEAYLPAAGRRIVQFRPYLGFSGRQWYLQVGGQRLDLPQPTWSTSAGGVYLSSGQAFSTGGPGRPQMPSLPEALFPVSVLDIGDLPALLLDHQPQWDKARRQALLDWLYRGGALHIAEEYQGSLPHFDDELDLLNGEMPVQRVGRGQIIRHRQAARQVNPAMFPAPPQNIGNDPGGSLFEYLSVPLRRHYNWLLIYLLVGTYVLLVGPLNLLLVRYGRSWQAGRWLLPGSILVFSAALFFVGGRGSGEVSRAYSFSYAQPLREGQHDVMQWTAAFSDRGDQYRITHEGAHHLYGISQWKPGAATVFAGSHGAMQTAIPYCTIRCLVHRGKMSGPDLNGQLLACKQDGAKLLDLDVRMPEGGLTEGMEIVACWKNLIYPLRRDGAHLRLSGEGRPLHDSGLHSFQYGSFPGGRRQRDALEEAVVAQQSMSNGRSMLITRALGQNWQGNYGNRGYAVAEDVLAEEDGPPADAAKAKTAKKQEPPPPLHILIFADQPPSFAMSGNILGPEKGLVLYHLCYPLQEEQP